MAAGHAICSTTFKPTHKLRQLLCDDEPDALIKDDSAYYVMDYISLWCFCVGSYVILALFLLFILSWECLIQVQIYHHLNYHHYKILDGEWITIFDPGIISLLLTVLTTVIKSMVTCYVINGSFIQLMNNQNLTEIYDQEFSRNFMVYLHLIIKYIIKKILEFICLYA
eukprot:705628_1